MNIDNRTKAMNDLSQQQQILRLLHPHKHSFFVPNYQKPTLNPSMMVQDPDTRHMKRLNITNMIFMFFRNLNIPEETCKNTDGMYSFEKSLSLARRVENILFKSAPSFQEYYDTSTLDKRIKALLKHVHSSVEQMSKKRQRLSKTKSSFHAERRRKMLRSMLGDKLYEEMICIVNEIRRIQRTSNLWMMSTKCHNPYSRMRNCKSILPPALSAIYFETQLVNAERRLGADTKSLNSELLKAYNWEELIKEARLNIEAFRELEKIYIDNSIDKNSEKTETSSKDHTTKNCIDEKMEDLQEKSYSNGGREEEKDCTDVIMKEKEVQSNEHALDEAEKECTNKATRKEVQSNANAREGEKYDCANATGELQKKSAAKKEEKKQLKTDAYQEKEKESINEEAKKTEPRPSELSPDEVKKGSANMLENKKEVQSNVNECKTDMKVHSKMNAHLNMKKDNTNKARRMVSGRAA